jgi:hypothetical protein
LQTADRSVRAIVSARDLYIIPTPGTLALLGLGGLAMNRRRR